MINGIPLRQCLTTCHDYTPRSCDNAHRCCMAQGHEGVHRFKTHIYDYEGVPNEPSAAIENSRIKAAITEWQRRWPTCLSERHLELLFKFIDEYQERVIPGKAEEGTSECIGR